MAWWRQATSHYLSQWFLMASSHHLSQCWPRFMSPFGVNRPQWVNESPKIILMTLVFIYSWKVILDCGGLNTLRWHEKVFFFIIQSHSISWKYPLSYQVFIDDKSTLVPAITWPRSLIDFCVPWGKWVFPMIFRNLSVLQILFIWSQIRL